MEKVLELIRSKGPVIPVQISREIGQNILIASAMLSELSSKGLVKVSSVKVGSSPLYYVPGQEEKLQNYSGNLHEKEKHVYDLLKQEKVLRDRLLQPVERVALRAIRDFAKPLKVRIGNAEEIFWKWYMLPIAEAEGLIRKIIGEKKPVKKEEPERRDVQKRITPTTADDFTAQLQKYFNEHNIEVIESKIVRKNSEVDYILEVPSAVGRLTYYCKAKNKKRSSDSDLSSAYAKGTIKKLPVLFLTTGDLTKKAKEQLNTDFRSITVKRI